ncbi:MAG: hypothetical protein B7X92_12840 [Novosphingobium sp. 17-62-9]|nr:MAG: hypothetical protein B7X92_12840 [Novosphingobium sp. 17-62-9]HQS97835.1 hypothetical protein [Novosphingobium sp.]
MRSPAPQLTGALLLSLAATQLSGCAAAALVPLMAGGTLTGKAVADQANDVTPETAPMVIVGKGTSNLPVTSPAQALSPPASVAPTNPTAPAGTSDLALLAAPAALPASDSVSASDVVPVDVTASGFVAMTAFVLSAADGSKPTVGRRSALLDQSSLVSVPKTKTCADQRGALVIDLDPGDNVFDLNDPPSPAPELADMLRTIRGTGTAVVWIASLPDSSSKRISTILKATGLDPLGIDPLLLLRRTETRKQQILLRADADWCVLAIAGDRKADFDEVFDYLRNPDGPVAVALEQYIGSGWFLVPPPIK